MTAVFPAVRPSAFPAHVSSSPVIFREGPAGGGVSKPRRRGHALRLLGAVSAVIAVRRGRGEERNGSFIDFFAQAQKPGSDFRLSRVIFRRVITTVRVRSQRGNAAQTLCECRWMANLTVPAAASLHSSAVVRSCEHQANPHRTKSN